MPMSDKLISLIPPNVDKILVWAFVAFFVFDAGLSAAAALRMNEREKGAEASNRIEIFLDEHFDDERMHKIYANSKEVTK